jgi:hypothetical protein
MSTQLILYPQTYLGVTSGGGTGTNLVADGALFNSINSSSVLNSGAASPLNDIISTTGFFPSFWARWKTDGSLANWLTPPDPNENAGQLYLNTVGGAKSSASGVIQKLSSLVTGSSYVMKVVVETPAIPPLGATHKVQVSVYSANTLTTTNSLPLGHYGTLTTTFTAQSANDIIVVSCYDNQTHTPAVKINSIEVSGSTVRTNGLENGQVICDLYQEEDIPLTLSIDDFKNVSEQVKSYSKNFSLPGTKRNNQIFNNMFNVTRANDGAIFNPYVKTACLLKQDGFIIFEGYLRLIDVKEKQGQITYNVNLYSEVIALAEVLKDRTFSQLDFSELTNEYTFSNIKNSWLGLLDLADPLPTGTFAGTPGASTTGVLKYPYIDWNHQFSIDSSGNPVLPNLEAAFRPCIQLKYLIQNIFAATDFNYTSNFFDSADFEKLYMDFNWGADNSPVQSVSSATNTFLCTNGQGTHYAGTSYTNFVLDNTGLIVFDYPPSYDSVTNIITATAINETYSINYAYRVTNTDTVTRTIECRYLKNSAEINYSGVITLAAGNSYVYESIFNVSLDTGDTLQAQFKASSAGVVQQAIGGGTGVFSFGTNVIFIVGITNITTDTILQTLRGELGQWDFLKGIMTMFNLVSMVDENDPNNILIEPYDKIFIDNPNIKQLDWTDKIDVSEMSLEPLTDLNKSTVFKFVEDDDDHAFNVYKRSTGGHLYGSKVLDASIVMGLGIALPTILEGEKEIIAEPFAATVSIPLMPLFSDFIVPSIYSTNDDLTCEGFENEPRIFYDNGRKTLASCTYFVPTQNGVAGNNVENQFLQFSHFSTIPSVSSTTTDFVFESQQLLLAVGTPPVNNLYTTYWAGYFNELYNADTRVISLMVSLTPSDIATFNFYDKIFIRNRIFRVNKIEYKPNSLAQVEFILIP